MPLSKSFKVFVTYRKMGIHWIWIFVYLHSLLFGKTPSCCWYKTIFLYMAVNTTTNVKVAYRKMTRTISWPCPRSSAACRDLKHTSSSQITMYICALADQGGTPGARPLTSADLWFVLPQTLYFLNSFRLRFTLNHM